MANNCEMFGYICTPGGIKNMYSLLFSVKPTSGDCKEALQRRTDKGE